METKFIHITSGKGPAECCLAVALTLKEIIKEAKDKNILHEVILRNEGFMNGTLTSALLEIEGDGLTEFINSWQGTLLWIVQSPYRKMHKRKNWFIAINEIKTLKTATLNENEITYQTMRASGPGGQNVNKVETAVRASHKASGLFTTCNNYRSQLQNKKTATERLIEKYTLWQHTKIEEENFKSPWNNDNDLKRGNPNRIYTEIKFIRKKI
jgi:peptide chain release factor